MEPFSKGVLLAGEPMGLFIAEEPGALDAVRSFSFATCGAELNVAIGLRRLEQPVSYLTKLGDDPFGRRIARQMDQLGICAAELSFSKTHPTGFVMKERVEKGDPGVVYFRKGSAASTLSAQDVERLDFSGFDTLHLTGILPALSDSCREAAKTLCRKAKEAGCRISFDPNLRPQLWNSEAEMVQWIHLFAAQADLFLPGVQEAKRLIGESVPEKIAERYLAMGAKTVVLKLGKEGAYYASVSGDGGYVKGFPVKTVVDTVGAGDGFAIGVLSACREGLSLAEAVRRGCAIGAIQVMSKGDNDGLPTRAQLNAFLKGDADWKDA